MPTENSMPEHASGSGSTKAKKPRRTPRLKKRRLEVDDINVVNKKTLRTAISGTVVGNTMEWYDVGVFGYLITTMGPTFLPESDKAAQNLFLLGTFAATFIARPFGGIFFGWLGDKVGRQKVLAATLIMMAISTLVIGLLPGYVLIGLWAPALLVIVKLIQGFSTGGEYAGATTFVSEYAPDKRRGYFASFLDMGSYAGFAAGAILVSILQIVLGGDIMQDWGWRIPFLLGGPLGAIAIYFRLKIEESPQFQATLDANEEKGESNEGANPLFVIKNFWRPLLVAFVLVAAANTVGYALTSYMPTYLTSNLHYDELHGTALTIPVLVIMAVCIPFTGRLSDKIGRRPTLWIGALSAVFFSIPAFLLLNVGAIWSTLLGLALIAFPVTFYVSNLASSLPAQFPTASRYGGMGISYNLAVALLGGAAPFIIESLINLTGDKMAPAYYLVGISIVGAIVIFFLRESAGKPLPGSMPSVATVGEAKELVATQEENPDLDMDEMPFDETYEPPTSQVPVVPASSTPESADGGKDTQPV